MIPLNKGELEIVFCHRNTNFGFQFHPPSRGTPAGRMKTYVLHLLVELTGYLAINFGIQYLMKNIEHHYTIFAKQKYDSNE